MFPRRRDDPYLVDIGTSQGLHRQFTRYGCGAQARWHSKHLISGPWIRVNRDHAFSRCHVNLYIRAVINGHEFDVQSWFRFFDLLERRDNIWRIIKRTAVYEKDRMDPVDPRGVSEDFFADIDLSAFPASAKFLCYSQVRSGRSPSTNVISVYSDKERALREEGERWLKKCLAEWLPSYRDARTEDRLTNGLRSTRKRAAQPWRSALLSSDSVAFYLRQKTKIKRPSLHAVLRESGESTTDLILSAAFYEWKR
jgi:hypothetical protein